MRKLVAGGQRADLAARFGAWWDGRDYVPPPPPEPEAPETVSIDMSVKEREPVDLPPSAILMNRPKTKAEIRLRALNLIWGAQRFSPGSDSLDIRVLEHVFAMPNQSGSIGFIGADPAQMMMCRSKTDRPLFAAEWRTGCLEAQKKMATGVVVSGCDIDRPLCFPDRKIEAMVSVDAFAYADHKPGLAGRVHKALTGTGRWVVLDIVRNTPKAPPAAFASAWAEPQLATAEEIDAILRATGFLLVRREDATGLVVNAARRGIASMGAALDDAMKTVLDPGEGAALLQEVAWEIQSWQARLRALAGGALSAHIWIADKDPVLKNQILTAQKQADADMKGASKPKVAPKLVEPAVAKPEPSRADGRDAEASVADGASGAAPAKPAAAPTTELIQPPKIQPKSAEPVSSQAAVDALFD